MNRLGISIVLVFTVAFLLYLPTWLDEDTQAIISQQDEALVPNYEVRKLSSKRFDTHGNLTHEVAADKMEHYDLLGFVTFEAPVYTIYLKDDEQPWRVTAQTGTLYDDNRIQLEDSVLITNQRDTDFITQIRTEFIEIDLNTRTLVSDQAVKISGPDYIINSIGFNANLDTQLYELSEHVQTQYSPSR